MTISLDFAARKVIMASMLYYGLEESIMPDHEFDELSNRLADNWKDLSRQRQVCLGSPDKIRTSGFHIKVTTMAENAAIGWLERVGRYKWNERKRPIWIVPQKFLKTIGHWRPTSGYMWHYSYE